LRQAPPRLLLIGHGRFGRAHHDVWQRLADAGRVRIAGIVVASEASRAELAETVAVPVYRGIAAAPLDDIDAVDIVTPAESHAHLVRLLLPRAHVLVEKPLATSAAEATALAELAGTAPHLLAVAHVLRFHPLIRALRELVAQRVDLPRTVFGSLTNPAAEAQAGRDPSLEMLHWFDVLDLLFGVVPQVVSGVRQQRSDVVSLRYPGPMNAVLKLGWSGEQRVRTLELIYHDQSILADLVDQTIVIERGGQMQRLLFSHSPTALEGVCGGFLDAIAGHRPPGAPATLPAADAARIVGIACRAAPRPLDRAPRVAVIGGGIFGATCAAELAGFCDVTLFERHEALLTEASTLNQWRYHHGFHYPRSIEMIREIQACRQDFEDVYGGAIIAGVQSWYCIANSARIITPERYLHVCNSMGLSFDEHPPPDAVIDRGQVSLCLRTAEGVLDADRLRHILTDRLTAARGVTLALGHAVIDGALLPDGRKRLVLQHGETTDSDAFDYVINATYSNRNLLARLFGFPLKPLRFDLLELLILELPLPLVAATVLDGPFTSLVSTGQPGMFTLSHIQQSVLASATTPDGMPPVWRGGESNRENLLRHAARYLPVLSQARYVASRFGTRAVHALPEDVDGRPTAVVDHGFGCWSILGGKINTSVTNARQIAAQIAAEQQLHGPMLPAGGATVDDADEHRDRSPIGARRR
jgi:predicted dehydrogenase/glycine/D-amino acid oxidase-like deaminating enzyme